MERSAPAFLACCCGVSSGPSIAGLRVWVWGGFRVCDLEHRKALLDFFVGVFEQLVVEGDHYNVEALFEGLGVRF